MEVDDGPDGVIDLDFLEADYLAANPDVAAAVSSGEIASASDHFIKHGYFERRSLKPGIRPAPLSLPFPENVRISRRDRILGGLNLSKQVGVEIGALNSPLITEIEAEIYYVDFTDTATLRKLYEGNTEFDINGIVNVDAVWGIKTLSECLGNRQFDYVVASHVIEHVPDMITWLNEIKTILKPGGELRIVVPDKRFTYDILRRESEIHDVCEAFLLKRRIPGPRALIEFHSLSRVVDPIAVWRGDVDLDRLSPMSTVTEGIKLARDSILHGTYNDLHSWVFTPTTFAKLFSDLADLELSSFECKYFWSTEQNGIEFIVHLAVNENRADVLESWDFAKSLL